MIKYQGLSTLEVLQEAKNYNNWIAGEIKKHIVSPLLEVGAGTGNLTEHFLSTKKIAITDRDRGLVKHLINRYGKLTHTSVGFFDVMKPTPPSFRTSFSSVVGINVFEHIKDDAKAFKNIHGVLRKNGKLILLVPAKQRAYTKLDRDLGHYRRYEKNELRKKLEEAGFTIEELYFFNIVGLVSWYVRDKVSRNNIHMQPYQITLFDKIVPFLCFVEGKIRVPVGISLIAVAKKKK